MEEHSGLTQGSDFQKGKLPGQHWARLWGTERACCHTLGKVAVSDRGTEAFQLFTVGTGASHTTGTLISPTVLTQDPGDAQEWQSDKTNFSTRLGSLFGMCPYIWPMTATILSALVLTSH